MSETVVADSSCLIVLSKIKQLDILNKLFDDIYIPQAVYNEVVIQGEGRIGHVAIKNAMWVKTFAVKNTLAVSVLSNSLGLGESESMILAIELEANFLILDDWKARIIASEMSLPVIGTIAILRRAEENGIIASAYNELCRMQKVGFRCNPNLLKA